MLSRLACPACPDRSRGKRRRRERIVIQESVFKQSLDNKNMQNEPNLLMTKMNVSADIKDSYDNICQSSHEKNKPKTKPIYKNPKCHLDWSVAEWRDLFLSNFFIAIMQNEPNLQTGKMNTSLDYEYSYGKLCPFRHEKNKAKTNPISRALRLCLEFCLLWVICICLYAEVFLRRMYFGFRISSRSQVDLSRRNLFLAKADLSRRSFSEGGRAIMAKQAVSSPKKLPKKHRCTPF